jgi:hypothetical protein
VRIYTCEEWGAKPAKAKPATAGRPDKAIFHHTFSHASGPSLQDAFEFARTIQSYHMNHNGWNDTGNNFTITRSGIILEGRHGSIEAVHNGRMIVSAHCPGQNDQPGVEHEHKGPELMTKEQYAASVWLFAWICRHTLMRPTEIYPHSQYYATSCPAELKPSIKQLRLDVAKALTLNPYADIESEMFRWFLWRDRGAIPGERTLANVRKRIPPTWWARYKIHRGLV